MTDLRVENAALDSYFPRPALGDWQAAVTAAAVVGTLSITAGSGVNYIPNVYADIALTSDNTMGDGTIKFMQIVTLTGYTPTAGGWLQLYARVWNVTDSTLLINAAVARYYFNTGQCHAPFAGAKLQTGFTTGKTYRFEMGVAANVQTINFNSDDFGTVSAFQI